MSFSENLLQLKKQAMAQAGPMFAHIDSIAEANTLKVLDAMRECQVSEAHFNTTSGYAYDDIGRSKIEELFAKVFGAERALVRTNFVSGTHALATVLFGILRPGDKLVSITGAPYDTMQTVIGYANESPGSLKEFGVLYDELEMIDGKVDMAGIAGKITPDTKMVLIQRSRGYSMRNPLTIEEIGAICQEVKKVKPDCICFVDNCYGEFVDTQEPVQAGADIMAGSLIKNPGGGVALTGGYIGHAATVANHKVYDAFYSDDDRKALMHGPTFMGNALACAVALKGIEIFEREDYMAKIKCIEAISRRELAGFADERIQEIRIMGGCACIEVKNPDTLRGYQQFAYERGVFSRPFLSYMYSMVPYIIEEEQLVKIFDTMKAWFRAH